MASQGLIGPRTSLKNPVEEVSTPSERGEAVRSNWTTVQCIVLARDPPSRLFGRVFGHLDGFGRGGQLSKTLKNEPNGRVTFQN